MFRTVPGVTLQGQVASDESVAVSTTVTIDGATVEYTRRATADDEGAFSVVVPYPGTYELEPAAGETRTVTVDEAAVHENATVTVDW